MSGVSVSFRHDELVVSGLTTMLAPYAARVRVVPAGRARVDIAVCDAHTARPDASHTLDHLRRRWNADRIMLFGWSHTAAQIERALAAGADGYLGLELSAEQLVRAFEQVAAGTFTVRGPTPGRADPPRSPAVAWPGRESGLSERESQIIAWVAQGMTNQKVADEAVLSVNTVKVHIRNAYRTMGVNTRSKAVLWAIDHGFSTATMDLPSSGDLD